MYNLNCDAKLQSLCSQSWPFKRSPQAGFFPLPPALDAVRSADRSTADIGAVEKVDRVTSDSERVVADRVGGGGASARFAEVADRNLAGLLELGVELEDRLEGFERDGEAVRPLGTALFASG